MLSSCSRAVNRPAVVRAWTGGTQVRKITIVLALLLTACVNAGPEVILTNADGKKMSCGHYQSPAVQVGEYVAAANLANGSVNSCVEKYAAQGYGVPIPERRINAVAYTAAGPLHDAGATSPIQTYIIAAGTKGRFGFIRPDGVTCEGSFSTMQGTGANGLVVKYHDLIGLSLPTDNMVVGVALGSCRNGASFQAEYYVVRGTDSGFGVAVDGDGNVYKILT